MKANVGKPLFLGLTAIAIGVAASCLIAVTTKNYNFFGRGVLVNLANGEVVERVKIAGMTISTKSVSAPFSETHDREVWVTVESWVPFITTHVHHFRHSAAFAILKIRAVIDSSSSPIPGQELPKIKKKALELLNSNDDQAIERFANGLQVIASVERAPMTIDRIEKMRRSLSLEGDEGE